MIVKYNSLNRLEKPKLTLCNPGSVCNDDGTLTKVVGILSDHDSEEAILNFNSTSEFNFRINKIKRESDEDNEHAYKLYKMVQNRRLIYIDDIGYFMITEVKDGISNKVPYKDVEAKSIEVEIQQKMIPFIENGTYRCRDMLEKIVEVLPLWTIEFVEGTLVNKQRTFEDIDTSLNCLGFLLENFQDAYECIVVFDIINRKINVYDQENYVEATSIHLTRNDMINSINIVENADDLYTAISVHGDDENITIAAINPTGSTVIYNFDYYLDWMTDSLSAKVRGWQNAIAGQKDKYYKISSAYYKMLARVSDIKRDIEKYEIQIAMYKKCKDNIVAERGTQSVGKYNEAIRESGGTEINIDPDINNTLRSIGTLLAACESDKNTTENRLNTAENVLRLIEWSLFHFPANDSSHKIYEKQYQTGNLLQGTIINKSGSMTTGYGSTWASTEFIPVKHGNTITASAIDQDGALLSGACMRSVAAYNSAQEIVASAGYQNGKEVVSTYQVTDNTVSYIRPTFYCTNNALDHFNIEITTSSVGNKDSDIEALFEDFFDELSEIDFTDKSSTFYNGLSNALQYLDGIPNIKYLLEEDDYNSYAISKYFTTEEYKELINYIFEGSYKDEYVVVTDTMTHEQKFEQMKTLYDRAEKQLKKVSAPTQEFNIDVEDFIFVKEFEHWSEELETGCLINVELDVDDVAQLFLSSYTLNYDDHKLSLTFGNRFNRFDVKSLFEDVLGKISKSANTLNFMKDVLYPVKNGEINRVKEALQASRNLTMNKAISSSGEEVVIDESGYTGRQLLSGGEYDSRQVKIIGKNIVLTDDAWESCKVAIGELTIGDGESIYGINAENIIGDLIMGNNLKILDKDGNEMLSAYDDQIDMIAQDNELLKSQVSQRITPDQLAIEIRKLPSPNHIETASGYTFDDDGLKINRSDSEMNNKLDHTGMYVKRNDEEILTANAEGVSALNLVAKQHLTIGKYSRFEDAISGQGDPITACYFSESGIFEDNAN